jgi:hypothetical protein
MTGSMSDNLMLRLICGVLFFRASTTDTKPVAGFKMICRFFKTVQSCNDELRDMRLSGKRAKQVLCGRASNIVLFG